MGCNDGERQVFYSVTDRLFRFIHPLRQKNFENVFNNLPDTVGQLWVFGSAVTANCLPWSDLDICAVGGNITMDDRRRIIEAAGCETDLLVADNEVFTQKSAQFGHCYYNIVNTGILYYDKGWFDE